MTQDYEGDPPYPEWFLLGYRPFIAGGSGLLVCPRCKALVSSDKYAAKDKSAWYQHMLWHGNLSDWILND